MSDEYRASLPEDQVAAYDEAVQAAGRVRADWLAGRQQERGWPENRRPGPQRDTTGPPAAGQPGQPLT